MKEEASQAPKDEEDQGVDSQYQLGSMYDNLNRARVRLKNDTTIMISDLTNRQGCKKNLEKRRRTVPQYIKKVINRSKEDQVQKRTRLLYGGLKIKNPKESIKTPRRLTLKERGRQVGKALGPNHFPHQYFISSHPNS
jgi:hypothetical protein